MHSYPLSQALWASTIVFLSYQARHVADPRLRTADDYLDTCMELLKSHSKSKPSPEPELEARHVADSRLRTADDYLDTCMELLKSHSKSKPSPEPGLECPQYTKKSCCKAGVTEDFETKENWQNITSYVHCPQKSSLSPMCHKMFFDELCFFLCSPYIGPWIAPATHDEPVTDRFTDVPLCASECNSWWEACKGEYTCHENWYTDFDRDENGLNICKEGAECRTYEDVYGTAFHFCEIIWDHSFKVVPDEVPCMKFTFDPSGPDPNEATARMVAETSAKMHEEL